MDTMSVNIKIPKGLAGYIQPLDEQAYMERNAMILYPLVRNLTISHGRAAEILGIGKWELIEIYDRLGFPYLNQTPEELEEELQAYRELKEKVQ